MRGIATPGGCHTPSTEPHPAPAPSREVGSFLASVRKDRLYVAWLLLATLGMRRGELLGLRWVDVDLAAGRVAIRQARRAGLPPIRPHDLRHSVASILLARGVHPKVVSELLGHATIALTLDTYSHVIPSLQQEAAGVVAAAVLDPAGMATEPAPAGQVRAITSST
jgi:integrase